MKDMFRRRPVAVISLILYGAHCLLTVVGLFWREWLLMPAAFVWPYPFLLAIQRLVPDPAGVGPWLGALAFGFVLISVAANVVERRPVFRARLSRLAPVLAVLVIVVPLGSLTLLGYVLATVLGWPDGE